MLFQVDYSTVAYWPESSDSKNKWQHHMLITCFGDKWLVAELLLVTTDFVDKWGTEIVDHFLVIFIQRFSPLSSRLTALLSHVILNEWLAFNSGFLFLFFKYAQKWWTHGVVWL